MKRAGLNLFVDWALVFPTLGVFLTGLVLLLCFHVGAGANATSAFGIHRLLWLDIHRLSGVLVAGGVLTHVGLHWRPFCGRLVRRHAGKAVARFDAELITYIGFFVAALTGFAAWLVLDGSSPILGPVVLGPAASSRHVWIDAHNISSLASLVLVLHHVGHRCKAMFRL